MKRQLLFELRNIQKSFNGVPILKDINLTIYSGEVHIVLGENGAGKSTLIKLLAGAYLKDAGSFLWNGNPIEINTPNDPIQVGIACIYQELSLVPELTVYENIFLGRELKKGGGAFLDTHAMKKKAALYINRFGLNLPPDAKVSSLGMGQRQFVEIARALSMNARFIIMDEPTSSLSDTEVEALLCAVEELKKQGVAILYISHKLEELRRIGDRISILRDGSVVGTYKMSEISTDQMIRYMIGREVKEKYPKRTTTVEQSRAEGFRVESIKRKGSRHPISFSVCQGEVLGIAGLVGAGRTELAQSIFGLEKAVSGEIYVFGERVMIRSPRDAIDAGIAFISENRKEEGLVLNQSVEFNMSLTTLPQHRFISRDRFSTQSARYIEELNIVPKDTTKLVGELSGGNQQKVVIAKWLSAKAKVYIFDEPTKGIDIGAKVHVYHVIHSLVEEGAVVIVISSELSEILGLCDRVLVMREGQIAGDFLCEGTTQEQLMLAATGGTKCKAR